MFSLEFIEPLHVSWINEYRQTRFGKCLSDARKFIEKSSHELPKDFKNKRVAKRKRMFDYEGGDKTRVCQKSRNYDFFYIGKLKTEKGFAQKVVTNKNELYIPYKLEVVPYPLEPLNSPVKDKIDLTESVQIRLFEGIQ
ncbi:UNVERIFIED_CONTAM: hypothetical protein NCL1_30968 [Trichonephila clavipes]